MALDTWKTKQSAGVVLAAGSLIAVTLLSYYYVKRHQLEQLHHSLASRAELYAATIGGALDKYEFLPLAVAQSDAVAELLQGRTPQSVARANAYLEDINGRAGAFAVYVLAIDGTTVASSNWKESTSYVGQNYGFRPYFKQAAAGGIGRFYGIGASTFAAGYFISQPIRRQGRIIGVAATKVSLDWIEQSWRGAGVAEQIWVRDANGVIILSSIPAFKFQTLAALSPSAQKSVREQRQFLEQELPILPHRVLREFADGATHLALGRAVGAGPAAPADAEYLAVSRALAPLEWRITVLAELDQARAAARNAATAAALAWALLLLATLYARQRRRRIAERLNAQQVLSSAYGELEIKVARRTSDLLDANRRLQAEVGERERAEQTLRLAQAELVQSGKLAAIGQMAAGVTHELNQPLAALQTFSDNAKVFIARGRTEEALENLSTISDLVQRLGYITSQLRGFARRGDEASKPVDARQAFAQTMLQVRTRPDAGRLQLSESWPARELVVLCSAIGMEQVFSNLIANAMDAVPAAATARIALEVERDGGLAQLRVSDNGPGIPEGSIDKIFDPFHTTKEHGLGLGLSISAGIVRAAGGTLSVRNRAAAEGGGAQFTITLACRDKENANA